MKFYVSGKARGHDKSLSMIVDAIERTGHELTLRWWDLPVMVPYHDHMGENALPAAQMVAGIKAADHFVVCYHDLLWGALIERGIAHGAGIPVHIVGDGRHSIFDCLVDVDTYSTPEIFIDCLETGLWT